MAKTIKELEILPKSVSEAEWFKTNILDDDLKMKEAYINGLSRFEWVESFDIVDISTYDDFQLQIVLNFDEVPRTEDIVELFGEEILPFITYNEFPRTKWFESNIFGGTSDNLMKEKYTNELSRMSWVKDFYIGFDDIKDKTWKIYIKFEQNQNSLMDELEKIFGVNIYSFVDLIKEPITDDDKSAFLRGPSSGDTLHFRSETGGRGTVSILCRNDYTQEYYAVTCYHACYNGDLPVDFHDAHRRLKEDSKLSVTQVGTTFKYTDGDSDQSLGWFYCGLYDDSNDIALVKLDPHLNCKDELIVLQEKGIERTLASKREVFEMFRKMNGSVPVGKLSSLGTNDTKGELFTIRNKSFFGNRNTHTYGIRSKDKDFAGEGDSGSLVYMISEDGKKIPFAYLYACFNNVYYGYNLKSSLEALQFPIKPCLVSYSVDEVKLDVSSEEDEKSPSKNITKIGDDNTKKLSGKKILSLTSKNEWFKNSILDSNSKMKEKFAKELSRLKWVESFEIFVPGERSEKYRLEIICKSGKVHNNKDIMKLFGKEILSFITYRNLPKNEWFEKNIFDEDFIMKEDYANKLLRFHWVENFKIIVGNKPSQKHNLEIVCRIGKVPIDEDIVKLFGEEILPFITYRQFSKAEWFELNILDGDSQLKEKFANELSRLKWVESFEIFVPGDRSEKYSLEIICKSGKVPNNKDIMKLFGKEILSFITYRKLPKNDWFEKNIFDEDFIMKEDYANKLLRLPWVKGFYIGFDGIKDKTWKIYITYKNQEPSMDEVEKIFGVNIHPFVELVEKPITDDSKSGFHRRPRSGDALHLTGKTGGSATISILCAGHNNTQEHYAVTCYHVCFKEDLNNLFEAHGRIKAAFERNPKECVSAKYEYTDGRERHALGTYSCGKYSDKHDIALVKLECLNCQDAVDFFEKKDVEDVLASKKEVIKKFKEMGGSVLVEKFGSVTGEHREGELFAIDAGPLKNGMNRGFYGIKSYPGKEIFSEPGDSGSLVCMICEDGRKVPFAYLSNTYGAVYYCPNLQYSLKELSSDMKPCLRECGFP